MTRRLFLRIADAVCKYDEYFVQKPNCVRVLGLSPLLKCIAALRMLAYWVCDDATDECCRLAESIAMESLKIIILGHSNMF